MRRMHCEKHTLPFVAILKVQEEWSLSMNGDRDPEFSFARLDHVAYRSEDAFEACSKFLNIKSPEEARIFFLEYGPFQFVPQEGDPGQRMAQSVRWSLIQKAQADFGSALMDESVTPEVYRFVFQQPLQGVELRFRAVTPELLKDQSWIEDAAIVDCPDVVTALRASIFLTRQKGFKWKRCAREDCNQIFEAKDDRQKFHDYECGHVEAQRRHSARKQARQKKSSKRRRK